MDLYLENSLKCSRQTTYSYSTSFSLGIRMLKKRFRPGIFAVYGFVRIADEIVDTFHHQPQRELLEAFRKETWDAIEKQFSTNPILHSFQWAVNRYGIDHHLIEAFLYSMELDLTEKVYNREQLNTYIYGSAEVVGLMCLRIFLDHDVEEYNRLVHPARKLGEAFQKVNFLRDIKDDYFNKGRKYFGHVDVENFTAEVKQEIEREIKQAFDEAYTGIKQLHPNVRFGVYLAYRYYLELLKILQAAPPDQLLNVRCRVPDRRKFRLMLTAAIRNSLNII